MEKKNIKLCIEGERNDVRMCFKNKKSIRLV